MPASQVWCGPLRKQGKKKKGKKGSAVEAQEGPSAIAEPLKQQMPKTCQAIAASLEVSFHLGSFTSP